MAGEIDEAWVEEAIERYRRIEAVQAEFDKAVREMEVTVRSPDDLVQVVVAGDGTIRQVAVVGSLAGRTNHELSRAVHSAVAAAADAARWARQKLRAETFADYPPLEES
ncbi:MAG: YbaB/EbfC family nucleoid-associated protein [Micromonosporaceae bacterium]|jgi:DNA-binding protein YbaB|nr:YbaB/EbfC family nucleoid-associated protein [Micromonosporaceae bacterium]